jgi:hypothetical protein
VDFATDWNAGGNSMPLSDAPVTSHAGWNAGMPMILRRPLLAACKITGPHKGNGTIAFRLKVIHLRGPIFLLLDKVGFVFFSAPFEFSKWSCSWSEIAGSGDNMGRLCSVGKTRGDS